MSLNKTYIALGTNVGNWKNNFNNAVRLISNVGIITQFASILNQPMTKLAGVLSATMTKLASALTSLKEQKQ